MNNKKRFDNNLKRVESMCSIYMLIKQSLGNDKNQEYKYTDILRASVVFMHSSFEDYFRAVIIKKIIENGSRDSFDEIGLPAESRNKGFKLKDLLEYKDLTVKELIEESVNGYMSKQSFNDFSQICGYAKKIGLDMSKYTEERTISIAIERRHKIVHEADMKPNKKESLSNIRIDTVKKWIKAYVELVDLIDSQINS